jgi:MFS family permease
MIRRYIPKDLEELIQFHERFTSPLSLIVGFLLDTFILLRRVDLWQSNALLLFYLALAAGGIILLNAVEAGRIKHRWILWASPALPVIQQFAFGALFSGFVSLYSRSASFYGTWIFVAVLACLMVGNERFRKLYMRFSVQIAMYFSALFLFLIFFLPIVFHHIGDFMFILSGLVAVGITVALLYALSYVTPVLEKSERTRSARSIAALWALITFLYFTNLIPPLPLALKDAGVYHSVKKLPDGTYELQGEPRKWHESILPTAQTFHKSGSDTVYVFTAVFAPTGLSTPVTYLWQRYDESRGEWVQESKFNLSISGGRDGGYRGYSLKTNPKAGKWRVSLLTPNGSVIGRVSFTVENASSTPQLEKSIH